MPREPHDPRHDMRYGVTLFAPGPRDPRPDGRCGTPQLGGVDVTVRDAVLVTLSNKFETLMAAIKQDFAKHLERDREEMSAMVKEIMAEAFPPVDT